jgi:uncharacterized membrane protein
LAVTLTKSDKRPEGWDYNPSAWKERIPIIILAVIGFFIAGYLSLFQFKIIQDVWEPFFGNGSRKILTSPISHILPVPDGALGAFGYILDAVTGIIGGVKRFKSMPWIVIIFGIAVGPLGAISIMLVVFQPVLFDAWCTLCLVTALISVLMIGPAMDEILASLQYLKRVKKSGGNVWKSFWGKGE